MAAGGDETRKMMGDPYALGGFVPDRDRHGIKYCNIEFGTGKGHNQGNSTSSGSVYSVCTVSTVCTVCTVCVQCVRHKLDKTSGRVRLD